jgi:Putative polyhydroxyalkanoic acid system protein (PHA_gran_rgn)
VIRQRYVASRSKVGRLASELTLAFGAYQDNLGGAVSEIEWDENHLRFRLTALGQTIQGSVDVENDYVELRAQLPFVIRLLAKQFVPIVQGTSRKLLT